MELPEVEFFAEKVSVTIESHFNHAKMYFISGDVGPFEPGRQTNVPLWLALHLRQRHLCRILPPEWMDVEKLEEIKQSEIDNPLLTRMPCQHYREVAQLILCNKTDIPHAQKLQTLVKDIWDVRQAKLRSSVNKFLKSGERHVPLNDMTLIEVTVIKPFLTRTMDQLHQLTDPKMDLRSSGSLA